MLIVTSELADPEYLNLPYTLVLKSSGNVGGYSCRRTLEIATREPQRVAHYLPGTNQFLDASSDGFAVPPAARRGGAETM